MAKVKMYCPKCGEELTHNGYNYDTACIDFECEECGWVGIDANALTYQEAMEMLEEDDVE